MLEILTIVQLYNQIFNTELNLKRSSCLNTNIILGTDISTHKEESQKY